MAEQYTTSSAIIPVLCHLLVDYGMSEERIEEITGIRPDLLNNPDSRIAVEQFIKLWKSAIETSGNPALALNLRDQLPQDHMHFVLRIAYYSTNLEEALISWTRYASLVTDCNQVDWKQNRDNIEIVYTIISPEYQNRWFSEYDLSLAIRYARYFTGIDLKPVQVCFQHPNPGYVKEYTRIFHAPVSFEQEQTKIVFQKKDLEHKILFHDPYMKSVVRRFAELNLEKVSKPENIRDLVREFIIKNLSQGMVGIEMAATNLNMDRSTLHRKLKQHGTTFSRMLEETRQELSKKFLLLDYTNKEIAYLLGFADPSTFQHAFRRWFGKSPGEFRKEP